MGQGILARREERKFNRGTEKKVRDAAADPYLASPGPGEGLGETKDWPWRSAVRRPLGCERDQAVGVVPEREGGKGSGFHACLA